MTQSQEPSPPKLQRLLTRAGLWPSSKDKASMSFWREFLLSLIYIAALVMGVFALPPIIYLLIKQGQWLLVLIDASAFTWAALAFFGRRLLPYRIRAAAALFITYFLGVALLAKLGTFSGGPLWLFTLTILSGIFLGLRGALGALALNLLTCLGFTWLLHAGLLSWPDTGPNQMARWFNGALNLLLLNGLVAISVTVLVKSLQNSLEHETKTGAMLLEERGRLEREVEHRKGVETELARSESKHRMMADAVSDNIWTIQLSDNRFTYISPSVQKILGYSPEEIMQMRLDQVIAPESLQKALGILETELKADAAHWDPNRSLTIQIEQIRKNGSKVWVEISVRFIRDQNGRPESLLGVSRDITSRRQAQERLRQSLEQFEAIFESAPLGMATIDTDRRFIKVNPRICEVLGYRADELAGRSFNDFSHPEDRQGGRQRWQRLLESREDYNQAEKRYVHKDGSIIWALVSNSLVRDEQGRPLHFVSHLMDITDRKNAEAEKEQLEQRLRHTQKMEAVGTLAGGVAHDFNNIMQAIGGYTELVKISGELSTKQYNHLAQIEEVTGRARDLVDRLLTFGRKKEAKREPLDLSREVKQAAVILGRTLPKMISINLDLPEETSAIMADPGQVEQVLLNLGKNASDAMPQGGVLTIAARDYHYDPDQDRDQPLLEAGRYVELTVQDTGEGMDASTLRHVFEPFFTTKEVGKGTGLGLATVYGIAASHGGRITCQSNPGQGAVFRVLWPATEELTQETEHTAPSSEPGRGKGETLLLVDDEPLIIGPAAEYLSQAGYRTLTASSGEQAVALYRRQGDGIDLVIMDLGMPGMGGAAALERIKELSPGARVIVASGYNSDTYRELTTTKGASAYLRKPFKMPQLMALVRNILDNA